MTRWPTPLFFWFHGCLSCAVFLPSEKPTLSPTGPASLLLLFPASVCIPPPFCGSHGVSLLFHTPSLPPEQKGPRKLLSALLRGQGSPCRLPLHTGPASATCLAGSPQTEGSGRVCMRHLDSIAWEATEPSESPGSQAARSPTRPSPSCRQAPLTASLFFSLTGIFREHQYHHRG